MESSKNNQQQSGKHTSEVSLYQMYNDIKQQKQSQQIDQKIKKNIQEKLRISSSVSCSGKRRASMNKNGEMGEGTQENKNLSMKMSVHDSKDDLLDSPHLGLSEMDFKNI